MFQDRVSKQNAALRDLNATLPPVAEGGDLTIIVRYGTAATDGKMNLMTMKIQPMPMNQWVLVLAYYKRLVAGWSGQPPYMDPGMVDYLANLEKNGAITTDDSLFTS